jgi:hypothetical protein
MRRTHFAAGVRKQTVLVAVTLGFRTHSGFHNDQNGTRTTIILIILDIQTYNIQTYIHTYIHTLHTNNVLRGPGWRLLGIAMPPPLPR